MIEHIHECDRSLTVRLYLNAGSHLYEKKAIKKNCIYQAPH